jgi:hypothetical protein
MVKLSPPFLLALVCYPFSHHAGYSYSYSWGTTCSDSENVTFPSLANFASEMNSSFYGERFLNSAVVQLTTAAISAGQAIKIQKCIWILNSESPNGTTVMESNSSLGIQIMRFCAAMNESDCSVVAAFHGKQCSSARFACPPYASRTYSTIIYPHCWSADCSHRSPKYPHCVLERGIPRCPPSWTVSLPNTGSSWIVATLILLVMILILLRLAPTVHGWVVVQKFRRTFEPLESELQPETLKDSELAVQD